MLALTLQKGENAVIIEHMGERMVLILTEGNNVGKAVIGLDGPMSFDISRDNLNNDNTIENILERGE